MPLISILKIFKLFKILVLKVFKANGKKIFKYINNKKIGKMVIKLSKFKRLKNKNSKNLTCIRTTKKFIFLIFGIRKVYNNLRQAFLKVLIF